mgnify:CR=1 FL=1
MIRIDTYGRDIDREYSLMISLDVTIWFNVVQIEPDRVILRAGGGTFDELPIHGHMAATLQGKAAKKFKKLWAGVK